MLIGRVVDFYYNKIARRLYDFRIIVEIVEFYFKTEEN